MRKNKTQPSQPLSFFKLTPKQAYFVSQALPVPNLCFWLTLITTKTDGSWRKRNKTKATPDCRYIGDASATVSVSGTCGDMSGMS